MTHETRSSYRQIFKATSIFGGLQVYQILLTLVRSKFTAVLLGTQGMGISGLLLSTANLVGSLTNLGLGVSAVRNVSERHVAGDQLGMARVASVLRKLVWLTGLGGATLMVVFAPRISQLTFGTGEYAWHIRGLSIVVLATAVSSSQYVLLQGMRRLQDLAKANAAGATLGLLAALPFYYYLGFEGIAPALIFSSLAALSLAFYFGRRAGVTAVKTTWSEAFAEGRGMMRMGVMLSLSGLFGLMTGYFTNVFIGRTGSLADVGLYSAGFALVNTYVGMIFSAMGTDYYPRLSAVAVDKVRTNQLVNQQMEMALLILGPILVLFMILVEVAIRVLYSSEFLGVAPMVQWSVLAIFLKAAVWSMGYLLLAHDDARVFLVNELTASAYTFILNISAYAFFGLEGLGVSFLVAYMLSLVQTFLVVRIRYDFRFAGRASGILGIQLLLGGAAFALVRLPGDLLVLGLQVATLLVASAYSIIHLNRMIDLVSLAKGIGRKN